MLGLRPRLRPRPSLLELVRNTNTDDPHGDTHPTLVPLPTSPVLHQHDDHDDVETPPTDSPAEPVVQEEQKKEDKMPPVSMPLGGAGMRAVADDGGV